MCSNYPTTSVWSASGRSTEFCSFSKPWTTLTSVSLNKSELVSAVIFILAWPKRFDIDKISAPPSTARYTEVCRKVCKAIPESKSNFSRAGFNEKFYSLLISFQKLKEYMLFVSIFKLVGVKDKILQFINDFNISKVELSSLFLLDNLSYPSKPTR